MMEPDNPSEEELNSYYGRWVALLRGKVVAQGGTPEQALRAAQKSRYKEKPEIVYMSGFNNLNFPPLFDTIRNLLADEEGVFLVGGVVRDVFLKRSSHDMDFAVKKNAIQLARKIADKLKAEFYPLDIERDTGRVLITGQDGSRQAIDFAAFRGDDLETDLRGRDFTINAMAIDPKDLSLHDPLGGLSDLREKCLRACSGSSFKDDPVRILRAIRLAAAFGFRIPPESRQAMKDSADQLAKVSPERQRDELFRILEGPRPAISIKSLDMLGALEPVLPELLSLKGVQQAHPHVQDVWSHTMSIISHLETILAALSADYEPETASDYYHGVLVLKIGRYRKHLSEHLSNISNNNRTWREILFFSALYHDIAKPGKSVTGVEGRIRFWGHEDDGADIVSMRAHKLALSNDEINRLSVIVRNHMRIHFHTKRLTDEKKLPTRRAIYRFFRDVGEAGVDICLLTLADLWATYENSLPEETWVTCLDVVRIFLESWWEKKAELITPPQLISGVDLMQALSIGPGPEVGRLLEAVREAQVVNEVNDNLSAINYARDYRDKLHKGEVMEYALVNNTRLAFFQRPGSGMPIVLIHGYPLDHTIWQPIIPILEKDAHLILPDLRGHGSSPTPEGTYSVENMADDISGLLDFLRVRKAILVGHSLGGYVALAFANKYPQKLKGLGLVASKTNADNAAQKEARLKAIADIQVNGVAPVADTMSAKLVVNPNQIPDLHKLIMKMDPAGAIGALYAMAERDDSSKMVANLKIPIMVVAGVADVLIPIETSRQMTNLSSTSTYMELEGVGHMPMLEAPIKTAEAINKLINEGNRFKL